MDENKVRIRLLPKGDFEATYRCACAECRSPFFSSKSVKDYLEITKNDQAETVLLLQNIRPKNLQVRFSDGEKMKLAGGQKQINERYVDKIIDKMELAQ